MQGVLKSPNNKKKQIWIKKLASGNFYGTKQVTFDVSENFTICPKIGAEELILKS